MKNHHHKLLGILLFALLFTSTTLSAQAVECLWRNNSTGLTQRGNCDSQTNDGLGGSLGSDWIIWTQCTGAVGSQTCDTIAPDIAGLRGQLDGLYNDYITALNADNNTEASSLLDQINTKKTQYFNAVDANLSSILASHGQTQSQYDATVQGVLDAYNTHINTDLNDENPYQDNWNAFKDTRESANNQASTLLLNDGRVRYIPTALRSISGYVNTDERVLKAFAKNRARLVKPTFDAWVAAGTPCSGSTYDAWVYDRDNIYFPAVDAYIEGADASTLLAAGDYLEDLQDLVENGWNGNDAVDFDDYRGKLHDDNWGLGLDITTMRYTPKWARDVGIDLMNDSCQLDDSCTDYCSGGDTGGGGGGGGGDTYGWGSNTTYTDWLNTVKSTVSTNTNGLSGIASATNWIQGRIQSRHDGTYTSGSADTAYESLENAMKNPGAIFNAMKTYAASVSGAVSTTYTVASPSGWDVDGGSYPPTTSPQRQYQYIRSLATIGTARAIANSFISDTDPWASSVYLGGNLVSRYDILQATSGITAAHKEDAKVLYWMMGYLTEKANHLMQLLEHPEWANTTVNLTMYDPLTGVASTASYNLTGTTPWAYVTNYDASEMVFP